MTAQDQVLDVDGLIITYHGPARSGKSEVDIGQRRPGRIIDVIETNLPANRTLDIRETPEFLKIAHRVREGLKAGHSYED